MYETHESLTTAVMNATTSHYRSCARQTQPFGAR